MRRGKEEMQIEFGIVGVTEDKTKFFVNWGGAHVGLLDMGEGREIDVQRLANVSGTDIPIYRENADKIVDGMPVLETMEIIHPEKG